MVNQNTTIPLKEYIQEYKYNLYTLNQMSSDNSLYSLALNKTDSATQQIVNLGQSYIVQGINGNSTALVMSTLFFLNDLNLTDSALKTFFQYVKNNQSAYHVSLEQTITNMNVVVPSAEVPNGTNEAPADEKEVSTEESKKDDDLAAASDDKDSADASSNSSEGDVSLDKVSTDEKEVSTEESNKDDDLAAASDDKDSAGEEEVSTKESKNDADLVPASGDKDSAGEEEVSTKESENDADLVPASGYKDSAGVSSNSSEGEVSLDEAPAGEQELSTKESTDSDSSSNQGTDVLKMICGEGEPTYTFDGNGDLISISCVKDQSNSELPGDIKDLNQEGVTLKV